VVNVFFPLNHLIVPYFGFHYLCHMLDHVDSLYRPHLSKLFARLC